MALTNTLVVKFEDENSAKQALDIINQRFLRNLPVSENLSRVEGSNLYISNGSFMYDQIILAYAISLPGALPPELQ